MEPLRIDRFPFGKSFAVALVDDTDGATLAGIRPVYDLLSTYGIRITKTVWPLRPVQRSGSLPYTWLGAEAETLDDGPYREYCLELQDRGHELAMHTASGGDNTRSRTRAAYEVFERTFGHPPITNVMHGRNRENLYWGKEAFRQGPLHRAVSWFEPQEFCGHRLDSPYFWGDICFEKTRYVRLLETRRLNTLAFDPSTPFHDPEKPFVHWWFSSTYGGPRSFYRLITPRSLVSLGRERGAAIIHTYIPQFAEAGDRGVVHPSPRFRAVLELLVGCPNGWYVPIVELLDRIRAARELIVRQEGCFVAITNASDVDLRDVALTGLEDGGLVDERGRDVGASRNSLGQILLGDILRAHTVRLRFVGCVRPVRSPARVEPNYGRMFAGTASRVLWQYVDGQEVVPIATGRIPALRRKLRYSP